MVCGRSCDKVACEWQLPFLQLGSQNKDGVHAGIWWRPPKLILMSLIFFDVVSTATTAANPTINKQ